MTDTIQFHDSGSGFPILWIHGFPLSSEIFEPQTHLAGYRHIRPDLRGFGGTPPVDGELSMKDYARDVLAVLDKLGIDRAVIGGVSMGGYIAMQLLRDAPERFAAVLLLDTRETADDDEARKKRYATAEDVQKNGIGGVVESMLPKMVKREELRPAIRAVMESSTPQGVIAALKAMATRPDSADTLRNCPVPAFVIVGDRDEITPPKDSERMMQLLPRAEMAPIAHAAHLANFDAPEQVNNLLAAWLERVLRGRN